MKKCFEDNGVKQADWVTIGELEANNVPEYPILAKRVFGFKGKGMVKIDNQEQLEAFIEKTNLEGLLLKKLT